MCNKITLATKLYNWELRNGQTQPQNEQRLAISGLVSILSENRPFERSFLVILHHIECTMCKDIKIEQMGFRKRNQK